MTELEKAILQKELKAFLDEQGRMLALPARRKKQLMGFYWIASHLDESGEWNERALNEALNHLHTFGDPATIRRTLFDLGVLDRDPFGKRYTLRTPLPSLEAFLARGLQ